MLHNCAVIIPTIEFTEFLEVALEETLRLYPGIELIVISDKPFKFKNVQVLKSHSKRISDKRNQGVMATNATYVFFLDSDAYPLSGWIESALRLLKKENVGIVGGPNLEYKKLKLDQTVQSFVYKSFLVNNEPNLSSEFEVLDIISSSNMAIKKSTFIELGMFNEKLMTGEDIELCYRAKKMKLVNFFIRDMKVCHKQRNFIGFLKQRYVWGRGVFNVLRYCFPHYMISLMPLVLLIFFVTSISFNIKLLLPLVSIYILLIGFETLRVCKKLSKLPTVFIYIFLSLPCLAIGTLTSLFIGDVKSYKNYQNVE